MNGDLEKYSAFYNKVVAKDDILNDDYDEFYERHMEAAAEIYEGSDLRAYRSKALIYCIDELVDKHNLDFKSFDQF